MGAPIPGIPLQPPPAGPIPIAGAARVMFQPANIDTQLSSAVTVTLLVDNVSDLASAAAHLSYDSRILRINNIVSGDLPQRNGPPLEPARNILNDSGQADMSLVRGPTDGGVSGSGGLFTVVFQAVGRGNTNVSIPAVSLTASTGQPIGVVAPPPLVVNVR